MKISLPAVGQKWINISGKIRIIKELKDNIFTTYSLHEENHSWYTKQFANISDLFNWRKL